MAKAKPCNFSGIYEFSIEDLREKFKANTETFFRFVNFQKKKYHNKLNHYDTKKISSNVIIGCYKQEICSILNQISNFQKVLDEIFGEYDDHIDQKVSELDLGFTSLKKLYLNLLDEFENQENNQPSGKKFTYSYNSPEYVSNIEDTKEIFDHSIDNDKSLNDSKESINFKSFQRVMYNYEEEYENSSNQSNEENLETDDSQVENNELLDSIETNCKESSNSKTNNDSQNESELLDENNVDKASSDSKIENEAHNDAEQKDPEQDCFTESSSDSMSESEYYNYFISFKVSEIFSISYDFESLLVISNSESSEDSKIVNLSSPEPTDTPPPI